MRRRSKDTGPSFRGIQSAVEKTATMLAQSFPQEWYDQPDWQPIRLVRSENGTYALVDRNRLTVEAIRRRHEGR